MPDTPKCQEPRLHRVARISPGSSWTEEFPCGRPASAWHNGRPMCRNCRALARRAEARHWWTTESERLGTIASASPIVLLMGLVVAGLLLCRDLLWADLFGAPSELDYWAFALVVWVALMKTEAGLAWTWRRWRGKNQ